MRIHSSHSVQNNLVHLCSVCVFVFLLTTSIVARCLSFNTYIHKNQCIPIFFSTSKTSQLNLLSYIVRFLLLTHLFQQKQPPSNLI